MSKRSKTGDGAEGYAPEESKDESSLTITGVLKKLLDLTEQNMDLTRQNSEYLQVIATNTANAAQRRRSPRKRK
jgi:hypothetical protein